jgi:hypothetical protein
LYNNDLSANRKGTGIDLNNYSVNNPYTLPCDGYVRIVTGSKNNNSFVNVYINGSDDLFVTNLSLQGNGVSAMANSLFVRKGMKVFPMNNVNSEPLQFIPLQI